MSDDERPRQNNPPEGLMDALKHMRFIHFTLVIAVGTIFYLLQSATDGAAGLVQQLDALKTELTLLLSEAPDADVPAWMMERAEAVLDKVEDSVDREFGSSDRRWGQVNAIAQQERVALRNGRSWPTLDASLDTWKDSLTSPITPTIKSFELSEAGKVWVQERDYTRVQGLVVATGTVNVIAVKIDATAKPPAATVTFSATTGVWSEGQPVTQAEKEEASFQAEIEIAQQPALPAAKMDQLYPEVAGEWEELRTKSCDEAKAFVASELGGRLERQRATFLGISVSGKDAGWVAMLFVLFLLAYLLTCVMNLKRQMAGEVGPSMVIPWVGVMQGWLPLLLVVSTLCMLPGFLAGYVLFEVYFYRWIAVLVGVAYGTLGGLNCYHARRLATLFAPQDNHTGSP